MLEASNTVTNMKNASIGLIRWDTAEERVAELINISVEISKSEKQTEKRTGGKEQNQFPKNCGTTKSVTYA